MFFLVVVIFKLETKTTSILVENKLELYNKYNNINFIVCILKLLNFTQVEFNQYYYVDQNCQNNFRI